MYCIEVLGPIRGVIMVYYPGDQIDQIHSPFTSVPELLVFILLRHETRSTNCREAYQAWPYSKSVSSVVSVTSAASCSTLRLQVSQ
jgi:hypothetical protein